MSVSEVSKKYARALFELSKANNTSQLVLSELRVLKTVFENDATIFGFVNSPLVAPEKKLTAIKGTFVGKTCPEVTNTLMLLAQKNRLGVFADLVAAFEEITDEDSGITRGTVRSATALSPDSKKKIQDAAAAVTGKKVIFDFSEDHTLLGGMVAQVGGWTFDDTLDSHLKSMSEDLNRRAN